MTAKIIRFPDRWQRKRPPHRIVHRINWDQVKRIKRVNGRLVEEPVNIPDSWKER